MRINEIRVDSYGELSDRRFDFSSGNFQMIYGPNETGKSTFLELIRDLLFDFSSQGKYQFSSIGRPFLSASLSFATDDDRKGLINRKLNLSNSKRRSESSGSIENSSGGDLRPLETIDVESLFGNADRSLFCNFFGFSYEELAQGRLLMKNSGLSDLVYGTGLGGLAAFQSVKSRLLKEIEELFKKSAKAKNPKINQILLKLGETNENIKADSVDINEYNGLRLEKKETENQRRISGDERERIHSELDYLRQLRAAFDYYEKFRDEQNRFSAFLDSVSFSEDQLRNFPSDGLSEVKQIRQTAKEVQDERSLKESEAADLEKRISEIPRNPELLKEADAIRRLERRVDEIQNLRESVRELRIKIEFDEKNFSERSKTLGLPDVESFLDQFVWTPEAKTTLRRLIDDEKKNNETAISLARLLQEKTSEKTKIEKQLSQLFQNEEYPTEEFEATSLLNQWDNILQKESYYRGCFERRRQIEKEISNIESNKEARFHITQSLATLLSGQDQLASVVLPMKSQIEIFEKRFADANEKNNNIQLEIRRLEKQERQSKKKLRELDPEGALPSPDEINQTRNKLNRCLTRLRNQITENVPNNQILETLNLYEQINSHWNELIETRINKAKEIAEINILFNDVEENKAEISRLKEELRNINSECDKTKIGWKNLWRSAGLEIGEATVSEMKEWSLDFEKWQEKNATLARLLGERRTSEQEIGRFETLCRKFSNTPFDDETSEIEVANDFNEFERSASLNEKIEKIRFKYNRLKEFLSTKEYYKSRILALENEIDQLNEQIKDVEDKKRSDSARFRQVLTDLNLPTDWSSETLNDCVRDFFLLQKDRRTILESRRLLELQQSQIQLFEEEVRTMSLKINDERFRSFDAGQIDSEETVLQMSAALAIAKKNESLYERNLEKLEEIRETVRQKFLYLEHKNRRLEELLQSTKTTDAREIIELGNEAERYRSLQNDLNNAKSSLETLYVTMNARARLFDSFDKYCRIFENFNLGETEERLEFLERKEDELDFEIKELLTKLGELNQKLKNVESKRGAAFYLVQKERLMSDLRAAIRQYLPRVFAYNLLESAQRKYENENEPEVLDDAAKILTQTTNGRYVKIQRSATDDQFEVVQNDGIGKTPGQLSSGTREQLYLSLRLAHVEYYCRRSESLPLVMDDILINFDNRRTENMLRVFESFASKRQIIFLTCRQTTMELFQRCFGRRAIELQDRFAARIE